MAKDVVFVIATLLVGVVVSVALWASVYNRWFWYRPPDQVELQRCVDDGFGYRWYVLEQRYVCHDNWTFPGFHGI
jgi:hypothetical protein